VTGTAAHVGGVPRRADCSVSDDGFELPATTPAYATGVFVLRRQADPAPGKWGEAAHDTVSE
jgi:hypothetical protein